MDEPVGVAVPGAGFRCDQGADELEWETATEMIQTVGSG